MSTYSFKLSSLLLLTIGLTQFNAAAQTNASTPNDFGTVVNGFQDNFTNSTRNPAWVPVNPGNEDPYVQTNGVLRVFSPTNEENPNHLIYNPTNATYDGAVQEVLVRIRSVLWDYFENNEGDMLYGTALSCQPTNSDSPAGGYCFLFMDVDGNTQFGDPEIGRIHGYQGRMLNEYVAWGPGVPFVWTTNQWYWMRLGADGTTINGKIWRDDGVTSEPVNWMVSWTNSGRSGFAAIGGSHNSGIIFEVDYFLLKANGLPSITVNPTANPLYFVSQPLDSTNAVGTSATFSVTVSNLAPVTYQWSKAPSGSTNFAAISGATNSSYTTPALSIADNSNQYSVFVSEGALSDTSMAAMLNIDTTSLTLVSAKSLGISTQIVLQFSESVMTPSNTSGFSAGGLSFSGVTQGLLPDQLVLTSSAMTLGTAYTLHASGVHSLSGNVLAATSQAISQILQMPAEFGTTLNGYQDDFTGASLNSNWVACPNSPAVLAQFTQANGVLNFTTDTTVATFDPEHLLYEPSTPYDSSNQEVLARIRINSAYPPDSEIRIGVGALCDPNDTNGPTELGRGAEAVFCDWDYGFAYNGILAIDLVDGVLANDVENVASDGQNPTNAIYPVLGEWYWIRLKCTGGTNIAVKFWLADGATPEPATFPQQDTFTASLDSPLYAGVCVASGGAVEDFDVDYIVIEAAGLPSISVSPPSDLNFGPYLYFTLQPLSVTVQPNTSVTLTVTAAGSAAPTYQWQSAPSGSSTFANIPGQTSTNLTETLTAAQSGTQYRVIASVPGLSETSSVATIVTGPPLLLSAQTLGSPTNVTLTFNRAVQTPGSTSDFSINHGVTISSVTAGLTPDVLVLTTSDLSLGTTYTLTAAGVLDFLGDILASTNINVSFTVYLPSEVGTSVAGYQDDFTASSLNTSWLPVGIDSENGDELFSQDGDGFLHVASPTNAFVSNPNILLWDPPTPYDGFTQEVLLRLRVTAYEPSNTNGVVYGNGLDSVGGTILGANTLDQGHGTTNDSGGIDWVLGNNEGAGYTGLVGLQAAFLNDYIAWGTGALYNWTTNTWYWLRESETGTNIAAGPNFHAKVWLADGTTPEPAAWQAVWSQTNRTGLAGIKAGSINANGETAIFNFDVSFFLLKAAGLPTITVTAPGSFSLVPTNNSPLEFTSIQSSGTNVVLQWTGSGNLQHADVLTGPWIDLVDPNGAFSPYTIPASSPAMFYRLRQ